MVTADKLGPWLEQPGVIMSSPQVGTVYADDATGTTRYLAVSSSVLDAASAARGVGWSDVSSVTPRLHGVTAHTSLAARPVDMTSATRGSSMTSAQRYVTRYVTPPRFC